MGELHDLSVYRMMDAYRVRQYPRIVRLYATDLESRGLRLPGQQQSRQRTGARLLASQCSRRSHCGGENSTHELAGHAM